MLDRYIEHPPVLVYVRTPHFLRGMVMMMIHPGLPALQRLQAFTKVSHLKASHLPLAWSPDGLEDLRGENSKMG